MNTPKYVFFEAKKPFYPQNAFCASFFLFFVKARQKGMISGEKELVPNLCVFS